MHDNEKNMIMGWEQQLYDDVKEIVDEIVEKERIKRNTSRPRKLWNKYYEKSFREKTTEIVIYKYRIKHTLNILQKCGLNINEFMKSSLGKSKRTDLMLRHIQGHIDGYEFYLTDKWDNTSVAFDIEKRKPIEKRLDVDNMQCTLVNDSLIIKSGDLIYEYHKDEHCLIYLNGEVVVTYKEIPTKEDLERLEKSMRRYLKEVEIASIWNEKETNRRRILSWEAAGKYYSD